MLRQLAAFFFLLFFSTGKTAAQQELGPPMLIGKVPKEDLDMTVFEADTSAAAVVLCDYGNVKVELFPNGAKLRSEFQRRIKILKRSAFDYGDVAIPFYSFKNREEFFFGKAVVHLPNGEKIKLKKKDVFVEEMNQYYSVAKFTFPQMEEGCIIEYSYFINSESIHELVDWFFQEKIPVRYSEVRADFPKYFSYSFLFQGNEGMEKIKEEENGAVTYSGKNGTIFLGDRRYVMRDAPAMHPEAFITTMADYKARIRFQLAEIRYPDGRIEQVMDTWENTKKDLDHHAYFGEQYLKKARYKNMTEQVLPLAKGLEAAEEKAHFFYDYLLENVEWTGRYSLTTRSEKLADIFATKKASSGELNFMLLVLLREAGITAYPLITSTRSNGKMYEDYPIIDQFDHTMVYAVLDGSPTIMDATDPLRPPGYPSVAALNGRGVLLKDQGSPKWIDIKAPKNGTDVHVFELALKEDGSLGGTIMGAYKGYNAIPERRRYHSDETGQHWHGRLAERFPGVELSGARTGNLEKVDESFFDTLELSITGAAQVAGDFMYLSPVLHSQFLETPFKQPERLYPVDIPYPFAEHYLMTLQLPDGYVVEELPPSAHFSLPERGGVFTFAVEEKEPGLLSVNARLHLSALKFLPHEYPAVKELFDLVAEKCGEQIVLKKG